MGLPVIGLAVRMVANGYGLTAEAIAARKQQKLKSKSPGPTDGASISTTPQQRSELSPSRDALSTKGQSTEIPPAYSEEYVELPPAQAERLIANGQAIPVGARVDGHHFPGHEDDSDEAHRYSEDEEDWALDEAAAEAEERNSHDQKKKYGLDAQPTMEYFRDRVLALCPPAPFSIHKIPLPVILPQKRPGSKDRGFISAYAPILGQNGIPEEAFLCFTKTLQEASKASPILNVVFLSAGVVGMVPMWEAQVASTVVQVAAGTAIELQKRQRTNSFLDIMNEHLFKPRGIFAMVMSYKPEAARPIEAQPLDMSALVFNRIQKDSHTVKGALKLGNGTTYGDVELPEAAALRFPAIDAAIATGDAEQANKLKISQNFLTDYYDRRAQAVFAANNPDSQLNAPAEQAPKFASRFSDPNDPVHNGSLLTLVTGGKVNLSARKNERREARRTARDYRFGRSHEGSASQGQRQRPRGIKGRRAMKKVRQALESVGLVTEVASLSSTGTTSPGNPGMHDDIAGIRSSILKVLDQNQDVLLVAHSAGGFLASNAIQGLKREDRIKAGESAGVVKLIFLTAALLPEGFKHQLLPFFETDVRLADCPHETMFFNGVAVEDIPKWLKVLEPQPAAGWDDTITHAGWKDIDSVYLVCENDRLIPKIMQVQMAESAGSSVRTCDAGHMPMLSHPEVVIEAINEALATLH
ncbi:uncharacterized protein KY384_004249 [Bacidia gigantensis]|uniref:uncharacterized protein n=1 Tax=Bacidia gigantensis TaxID=2732470 RepID=UPI001D0566A7|nr:uncharacterized protein KY384_004249 [Bacidia gigantensis]KAG8530892.1 hypothetical protein KY384_004249 [Bacidia gigantensis]